MNEQTPIPPTPATGFRLNAPTAPPVIAPGTPPGSSPLGGDASERVPVSGMVGAIEAILRQPRRVMFHVRQPKPGKLIASLFIISLICSLVYGLVVGTFSGAEQLWAAPLKIVLGLLLSAFICLPSLYIFSCLGGSHARLIEVFGLLAGLLALMTVLLVGFAPVAWVFSQSTKSVAMMGGLHLVFWFVATIFGLRFLHGGFAHFSARSFAGLQVWVVIFLLVALQMTTALRPIIGRANTLLPAATEKKFFLSHWLDCLNGPSENEQATQGAR